MKIPSLDSLVLIRWLDAYAGQSTWLHREELDPKLKIVNSVGWLAKIAKDSLVIAASHNADEGGWFSDVTVIPRNCIVEVKKIGPPP